MPVTVRQDICTRLGIMCTPNAIRSAEGVGNKIPGHHQQVGAKGLCQLHCTLQTRPSHIWPKMHVADLRDAEAVEIFWQPLQAYLDALCDQISRFQEKPVGTADCGNCRASNRASAEKLPARQRLLLHLRSLASPFRLQ